MSTENHPSDSRHPNPELQRLENPGTEDPLAWKLWGPYLSERQWGTVREDYSAEADPWRFFPHDHARSRAYRWGEDGLLGISDRLGRLCFALALWNGNDPILKERLFGLANPEGNHGEDVKELYYYLEAAPTASYLKALYKYPLETFPYAELVQRNAALGCHDDEFEILDAGVFERGHFDVLAEYAKLAPDDVLVRVAVSNRSPETAVLRVLPTLWFRNTWSWGGPESRAPNPEIRLDPESNAAVASHHELGNYRLLAESPVQWLFTGNETNLRRLFGVPNVAEHVKDAFHDYVVDGDASAVDPRARGSKAAALHVLEIPPGATSVLRLRLRAENSESEKRSEQPFGPEFDRVVERRAAENEAFHRALAPDLDPERFLVFRQANAGLVWSQQFYHYVVRDWVAGDPAQPSPPCHRAHPNRDWPHLHAADVLSMPDKWEFPWFAVWDTAFHMIPHGDLDPAFAKAQLLRFLRDRYIHPNGQIPAYEFNFADVNPPVHAWACRRVYERDGKRDKHFLKQAFHKLALNFTWWVNRKDHSGKHLFSGGFLGLDNIGVFDRSRALPVGERLEQADGTAWMAFFCGEMLAIACELALDEPAYADMATKFLEHYVAIADALNTLDGTGLWDEEDGFYYDHLAVDGQLVPLKVRSMVGLVPLFAVEWIPAETLRRNPDFRRRLGSFVRNRADLLGHLELPGRDDPLDKPGYLLSLVSRERLERVLARVFDENEFLSPHGVRSLSRAHAEHPYVFRAGGAEHVVAYVPGEADSGMFGGNSNWRGPVWFPVNYLLVGALRRYARHYGDSLRVPCPGGARLPLREAADEIARRLVALFLPGPDGRRPAHGNAARYADDPHWRELVLFYEYYHGDTGRGCGASHQTGWSALVASLLRELS